MDNFNPSPFFLLAFLLAVWILDTIPRAVGAVLASFKSIKTELSSVSSVKEARALSQRLQRWILAPFVETTMYRGCRGLMSWIFPNPMEIIVVRLVLVILAGRFIFFRFVALSTYLRGAHYGFHKLEQFRFGNCVQLERIYREFGGHQNQEDSMAYNFCAGELDGFDLRDLWDDLHNHPYFNGEIFHLPALAVAAILLGIAPLVLFVAGMKKSDGSAAPENVPEKGPGHLQELKGQTLNTGVGLPLQTPEFSIPIQDKVGESPLIVELIGTVWPGTGASKGGFPYRFDHVWTHPTPAGIERHRHHRWAIELEQELEEAEKQRIMAAPMPSLVEEKPADPPKPLDAVDEDFRSTLMAETEELEDYSEKEDKPVQAQKLSDAMDDDFQSFMAEFEEFENQLKAAENVEA